MDDYKEIVEMADTHGDEAVILLTQYTKQDILRARLMESIDAVSERSKNTNASEWIVPTYSAKHFYYKNTEIERTGDILHCEFSFTAPVLPPQQIVIKGRV